MATALQISRGAERAARDAYAEAIADQMTGNPSAASWQRVEKVLARAYLLSIAEGMAEVLERAVRMGADPEPPVIMDSRGLGDLLGDDDDTFAAAPFVAAINAIERRVPRLRDRIQSMMQTARRLANLTVQSERLEAVQSLTKRSAALRETMRGSFWVTDADGATTRSLRDLVADVIRGASDGSGWNLPEFIDQAQLKGAAGLTRARLETVMRNNVSSAYTDGRVRTLKQPSVRRVIPLVQIDEIQDRRSRETHADMDGYINTMEEIDRQGLRPPNGHNCRATLRPVSIARARRLGLVDEEGVPIPAAIDRHNGDRQRLIDRGEYPDEGFGT